ncbi:MAG: LysR family transcriptional regulator, partial [Proteobacteria bacterium]|nr:LysR family transcriptional regulator [Pseudomonadota bacterium]
MQSNFYYKNNRLLQLRGFCYAAYFLNISKAAKVQKLSPSTVSLQIKSLERDFKTKLFNRFGPKITLTTEGKTLLEICAPLIKGLDKVENLFLKELDRKVVKDLNIVANNTTINFILPELAKKFIKHNPDVNLTIHFGEQEEAIRLLRKKTADVALLPLRTHMPFPSDFIFIPKYTFKPALITRKDHPLAGKRKLTIQQISEYELALPAEELRVIPNLYEIFSHHNITKKLRINFINWETTKQYIEAGLVI